MSLKPIRSVVALSLVLFAGVCAPMVSMAQEPTKAAEPSAEERAVIQEKLKVVLEKLASSGLSESDRKQLNEQVRDLRAALGKGADVDEKAAVEEKARRVAIDNAKNPGAMQPAPGAAGSGIEAPKHPVDAVLKFEQTMHDWGSIGDEAPVTYSFKYKNTGTKTVKILGVKASCGCTGSQAAKLEVAPGEESSIDVRFDPNGRSGREVKTITVDTDDDKVKTYQLLVTSNVQKTIIVEPISVWFGQSQPGKGAAPQKVTITARPKDFAITKVALSGAQASKMNIKEVAQRTVAIDGQDLKQYEYQVTIDPSLPIGNYSAAVTFDTNQTNPKFQRVSMGINGEVVGSAVLNPAEFYVRMAIPGEAVTGEVQIVSRNNTPFKVLSATVEGMPEGTYPVLDVRPREGKNMAAQRILLSATAPVNHLELKGTVVLKTTLPDMETIRLPIRGWQAQPAQPVQIQQPKAAAPATQTPAAATKSEQGK